MDLLFIAMSRESTRITGSAQKYMQMPMAISMPMQPIHICNKREFFLLLKLFCLKNLPN
jgi:hypothetical protein